MTADDGTVSVSSVGTSGTLTPVGGSPFASGGPRPAALAFRPDGRFLAVAHDTVSGDVSLFSVSAAER